MKRWIHTFEVDDEYGRGWYAEVEDPVTGRRYTVTERGESENAEIFPSKSRAVDAARVIAREIKQAKAPLPVWKEDLRPQLQAFLDANPNRVDYVRLFWDNDPNGAYDGLLRVPLSESEEAFADIFEEDL